MSFPVTEHIAKREHSVILAEDNHTPPISSKSFSKVIENYICLTINRCIPAAGSLTLYPTSPAKLHHSVKLFPIISITSCLFA
jgi:hypothetical protein